MDILKQLQKEFAEKRQDEQNSAVGFLSEKEKLLAIEAREKEVMRSLSGEDQKRILGELKEEKEKIKGQLTNMKNQIRQSKEGIRGLKGRLFDIGLPEQTSALNDAFPILLLPLRIEYRFKKNEESNIDQLWVRAFPDDCQVQTKIELLSKSELETMKQFWLAFWKAGGMEEEQRGAWRSLVNSVGSGRATRLMEQYQPLGTKPVKANKNDVVLVVQSEMLLSDPETTAMHHYWVDLWKAKGKASEEQLVLDTLKLAIANDGRRGALIEGYSPANFSDPLPSTVDRAAVTVSISRLEFPPDNTINTTQTSWTEAPRAVGLPDRLAVICFRGNEKKTFLFEHPVDDFLAVGPDPSLPEAEQMKPENGNLKINEELKWMVDFEAAVKAGMGTRIDLNSVEIENGFDRIFVLGLRTSADEKSGQGLLETLLTNHYYSRNGCGLIPQGTPTNNSEEEASGYSWVEDPDESYDLVFGAPQNFGQETRFEDKPDGQKLAEYLGIDPSVVRLFGNARKFDQREAIAMNMALYPATLGYFIEEMMHPLFGAKDREAIRWFFTQFVSGRGPIPALGIGRQPYGILPVSVFSKLSFFESNRDVLSHGHGAGGESFIKRLRDVLKKMDETWERLRDKVSFVGKEGDPEQVLLDIISLQATSVDYHQRYAQTIQHVYNQLTLQFGPMTGSVLAGRIRDRGRTILQELDLPYEGLKLPIMDKFFMGKPSLLTGPLIDDAPLSETDVIGKYRADKLNYIQWLRTSGVQKIRTLDFGGATSPNALLFLLLRHALMQAQAGAGKNYVLGHLGNMEARMFHDPDFISIQEKDGGRSKWETLYSRQHNITGDPDMLLAEYIYKPGVFGMSPETVDLSAIHKALEVLESLPTARLERLMAEHIDCCSYRLDAWKTGVVTCKLMEQKQIAQEQKGVYLGSYGWLEEVRPSKKELSPVILPDELELIFKAREKSLFTDSHNLGYIHAPSLNQATAGAILRNAYETHALPDNANPFSINLSSERIRLAQVFLEAVRNGQSLSALLGYQFERGLHDKHSLGMGEVDKFIYPLRKKFPLVADQRNDTKTDDDVPIETIAASNVLDGLKLIRRVNEGHGEYPFGFSIGNNPGDLPGASTTQKKAIGEEVDRLLNIYDALADSVMAEQVYQAVQGNYERAAGNAEAFSQGAYPPQIEVVDTPRTGISLTQRVAIQFDSSASSTTSPNSVNQMSVRAKTEPAVNKWLSSILPDPEKVLCTVRYTTPQQVNQVKNISQKDLGLQSIDLIYLLQGESEQGMAALDDRIASYVRYKLSKHAKTDLTIQYSSTIDPGDRTKVSFFELAPLIKSLRTILTGSNYLEPTSLIPPGNPEPVEVKYDVSGLRSRIMDVRNELSGFDAGLTSLQTDISDIDTLVKKTNELFLQIGAYGIPQAGTRNFQDAVYAIYGGLLNKIKAVIKRLLVKHLEFDSEMDAVGAATTAEEKIDHLLKAEAAVATSYSVPPHSVGALTLAVDAKKQAFEQLQTQLNTLVSTAPEKLSDFLTAAVGPLSKIRDHDLAFLNPEEKNNDIDIENKMVVRLQEDIRSRSKELATDLKKRVEVADKAIALEGSTPDPKTQVNHLLQAGKELLGDDLIVLPQFSFSSQQGIEFKNAFDNSDALLEFIRNEEGKALPVEDWLYSLSRVREKMYHWEQVAVLGSGLKAGTELNLRPMQFPYQPSVLVDGSDKDRWLAMKFRKDPKEFLINTDKLLYTAHFAAPFDPLKPQCGLLVDDWTEVIPASEETTGLSFHFNQPNSEPPQVMMLVVPPVIKGSWEWDDIVDALSETLAGAKKRAVEPVHVSETGYGQFLPATMMAVTLYLVTVATNLAVNNGVYDRMRDE
jgi:hypothetical protein